MKPLRPLTFHLACLTVSLTFLANVIQAEETLKTTVAQTQPFQGAHAIEVANDLLTVKVRDVSLRELLEGIARQSDLTLVLSGSLEDRITIEFHQLSLEEGLRRILCQQSFAVQYLPTPEESSSAVRRPKTLWIFPNGKETYTVQTSLGDDSEGGDSLHDVATNIRRLRAALTSADSWEREEAVQALEESGRPEAVALLRVAVKDQDEDVREAAIAVLTNIGGEEAAQALAIALQDEDSSIREEAVQALEIIGGESAILLLEQALADEDESVREAAADILEDLKNEIR